MNKSLLLFSCLFLSSSLVADDSSSSVIQTNEPDVYIKNTKCEDNYRLAFNVVNKSNQDVWAIYMTVFDPSGDPIEQGKVELKYGNYIRPQSGYASSMYLKNCPQLEKTHKLSFTVKKKS
jgi:hypothetical protein